MINHSDFLMQRFKETVERNKQSIFLTDFLPGCLEEPEGSIRKKLSVGVNWP